MTGKLSAPRSSPGLTAWLARHGLEAERLHLRCWLGSGPPARCESPAKFDANDPWACALRGRILSLQGEFEASESLLGKAVRGLPTEACVRAWRGELALLRGDRILAEKELDAAVNCKAPYSWSYAYRAAARFMREDLDGARGDAGRILALQPASPAGYALKAILEAQAGHRSDARKWMARALAQGRQPWVYALRGTMRAKWNELGAARRDMTRALRDEDSPWLRLERAGVARKLGEFWAAFDDLEKATAVLPHHCEPHLRAAAIHLEQAQYGEAVTRLERALSLAPADACIHQRLARAHFVRGDLRAAQRHIETACRLSPADLDLKQERVQLLIVRGLEKEAEGALKEAALPAPIRAFWGAYLDCRRGRFSSSRKKFASVLARHDAGSSLTERARYYGHVARILEEPRAQPGGRRRVLSLIGLGYRHPFQVSLAAVRALAESDLIYSNLSDSRVTDFLGLFAAPFKVIVFRTLHQQAEESALAVMDGFRHARRIAVVTRGQPVVYGRLAYRLAQHCRARGISCSVPPSISIFESLPSLVMDAAAGPLGLQVRDASCLEGINPRLPLVVYLSMTGQAEEVGGLLAPYYPQTHPCHLLPGAGENEFVARGLALSELKQALREADPASTIYLPARRAR